MAYLLIFGIIVAFTLATASLYRYGNVQRQHILVTLSVLIAWSFSFLIVFTIPLDVTSTVYRQCIHEKDDTQQMMIGTNVVANTSNDCQQPWGMVSDDIFPILWRIIYWTSQFLTWLIMPLMQSYLKAGDFTFKGKLRAAVIDNAIYYGSYLFICGILLIYLTFQPGVTLEWPKIKAIASSASNTWGLFLLVLLFGYALVEVPRNLWLHSTPGVTLKHAYFKLAKLSTERADAEENVDDVLESLNAVNQATPLNHELRPCIETILRKVPTELMERVRRHGRNDSGTQPGAIPTEKSLIRLHKQVIKSIQTFERTEALWNVQVEKVLHLEDVEKNQNAMDRRFKTEFPQQRSKLHELFCNPSIEWYWQCQYKLPFMRSMAVILGALSAMVVWSELTFFNRSPVLSIFAIVVNVAKGQHDFLTIELFSMLTLCYLCYCAYSTIFRIKFLNLYYLAPHHATNEHSLIFSGMLLCRLTPPMCLNFLGLIHMDSHIIKKGIFETFYSKTMGHMDVIGIISDGFNIYFPMLMLAFCLATWYSLGSRALNALGFQQFMLSEIDQNESISNEFIQEGKGLIDREKRRRQRSEESRSRRRGQQLPSREPSNYRSNSSGGGNGGGTGNNFTAGRGFEHASRTLNDGLLGDGDSFDYNATTNQMSRTFSDEINERFGDSAQVTVGFKGYNELDSDNEDGNRHWTTKGGPPRGLFDDV